MGGVCRKIFRGIRPFDLGSIRYNGGAGPRGWPETDIDQACKLQIVGAAPVAGETTRIRTRSGVVVCCVRPTSLISWSYGIYKQVKRVV